MFNIIPEPIHQCVDDGNPGAWIKWSPSKNRYINAKAICTDANPGGDSAKGKGSGDKVVAGVKDFNNAFNKRCVKNEGVGLRVGTKYKAIYIAGIIVVTTLSLSKSTTRILFSPFI
jgi:hypothetical protein